MMSEVTVLLDATSSHLKEEQNQGTFRITNSGSVDADECWLHSGGSHPGSHSSTQKAFGETQRELVWRPW